MPAVVVNARTVDPIIAFAFDEPTGRAPMANPSGVLDGPASHPLDLTTPGERELLARALPVPRVSGIDPRTLFNEFVLARKPVVITNAIDDWPAMARWTLDHFTAVGDAIHVQLRGASHGYYRYLGTVTVADYARWLGGQHELLLGEYDRNHVAKPFIAYAQEGPVFDVLRRDYDFGRFTIPEHPDTVHAYWLGPEGAITPLHRDLGYTLNATIFGRKRWLLFPHTDERNVYPAAIHEHEGRFSRIEIEAPDIERYPRLRNATPYTVIAERGDIVVIPEGWWHHVKCMEVSASLSCTPCRGDVTMMPSRTRLGELTAYGYEYVKHWAHRRLGYRKNSCTCCFRVELGEQLGWTRGRPERSR